MYSVGSIRSWRSLRIALCSNFIFRNVGLNMSLDLLNTYWGLFGSCNTNFSAPDFAVFGRSVLSNKSITLCGAFLSTDRSFTILFQCYTNSSLVRFFGFVSGLGGRRILILCPGEFSKNFVDFIASLFNKMYSGSPNTFRPFIRSYP